MKVTVEDGVLTLSGERDLERTVEGKTYHRIERLHGTFSRSFTLPEDSDAESAAQFKTACCRACGQARAGIAEID